MFDRGYKECVVFLVENGASIIKQDEGGSDAMYYSKCDKIDKILKTTKQNIPISLKEIFENE